MTTKKKAAKKKGGSKSAKKKPSKSVKPAHPPVKEVDAKQLSEEEARKRCAAIYKLEKVVESKRVVHELAKRSAASSRASLKEAEEALTQEIQEQRFGPGPLFNTTGDGPA